VPLEDRICIQWICAYKLSRKRQCVRKHPTLVCSLGWTKILCGSWGSATVAAYISLTAVVLVAYCNLEVVRPRIQQVVLTEKRAQHRTVTRALGAWWKAPINRPTSPARGLALACELLRRS